MPNTLDDKYLHLENKVNDIDAKQKKLEDQYQTDLENIYIILKKLEVKIIGGGLEDDASIGIIAEMRDLNREMGEHTKQTETIKNTVEDIKKQLLPSQQLTIDVASIKTKLGTIDIEKLNTKVENQEKYRYMIWGAILVVGWILNKAALFVEHLIK